MRWIHLTAMWACLLGGAACAIRAEDATPPVTERPVDPTTRIQHALAMPLDSIDDKEHTLSEMLQLFSKLTNENFVLDPGLPSGSGDTKLTIRVQKGGAVIDAFSVVLALTGLRYVIQDNLVFVSSEERLARRLLSGATMVGGDRVAAARHPVTTSEAVTLSQPFDRYQDDFIGAESFISNYPWRQWEAPRYNPSTGLTDYPGPPVMMDSPDVGHPRFRYTSRPYFLKPEYLAIEQDKQEMREADFHRANSEHQADERALAALLQLMKDNPNLTSKDILDKLGK